MFASVTRISKLRTILILLVHTNLINVKPVKQVDGCTESDVSTLLTSSRNQRTRKHRERTSSNSTQSIRSC